MGYLPEASAIYCARKFQSANNIEMSLPSVLLFVLALSTVATNGKLIHCIIHRLCIHKFSQRNNNNALKFSLICYCCLHAVVQSQFLCVVSCAADASSVAILDTVQQCCATGGVGGYYPLLVGNSFEDCMECTDFECKLQE